MSDSPDDSKFEQEELDTLIEFCMNTVNPSLFFVMLEHLYVKAESRSHRLQILFWVAFFLPICFECQVCHCSVVRLSKPHGANVGEERVRLQSGESDLGHSVMGNSV